MREGLYCIIEKTFSRCAGLEVKKCYKKKAYTLRKILPLHGPKRYWILQEKCLYIENTFSRWAGKKAYEKKAYTFKKSCKKKAFTLKNNSRCAGLKAKKSYKKNFKGIHIRWSGNPIRKMAYAYNFRWINSGEIFVHFLLLGSKD